VDGRPDQAAEPERDHGRQETEGDLPNPRPERIRTGHDGDRDADRLSATALTTTDATIAGRPLATRKGTGHVRFDVP
jgi:hypothetical protein